MHISCVINLLHIVGILCCVNCKISISEPKSKLHLSLDSDVLQREQIKECLG